MIKKFLALFALFTFFAVSFSFTTTVGADGFTGSGHGLENDPFIITSCTELQEMNLDLSSYFKLNGASGTIDCTASSTWNSGDGFQPIGATSTPIPFTGHLDGNHNVITNLYIHRTGEDFVGLFAAINSGATVSNFGLTSVNITGRDHVGALAGSLSGTATSVYSKGTVNGRNSVGGLVGSHVENNSWFNSSPLVYTWNGQKYKYVDDVGNMIPKNVGKAPDLATIDKADLVPKDGKYSMKISEEYNEIVYYDELSLSTYDHAPGYSVAVPLNRTSTASDIKTVSDIPTNPLLSCTDSFGNDCTDALKANDDKWAYQDKSFVNSYIMDFGDLSNKSSIQLVMRAARDYAASARLKAEGTYQALRTVQVKDTNGNWKEIYNKNDLGSDGTPRLRTIDLTNKFLTNDYHVKVGFDTMNVNYFAVDTSSQVPVTIHTYHPTKADLSFRGFTQIDYTHYNNHNYDIVSPTPNTIFKGQYGNFTKYGDVSPLLQSSNNQFVIMHPGDHMDIEFPYNAPENGQVRDFVLNNNVWYKHASNDGIGLLGKTVNPLPYIGMTAYTADTNGYPMTQDNIDYLNTWNTRVISGTPQVDTVSSSTIITSYSEASVVGVDYVGALVGYNEKEIRQSYSTGNVSANCNAGGLVGWNNNYGSIGWIHDSYALGNVHSNFCSAGGLVGFNNARIEKSYAKGVVTVGNGSANGLVGGYWGPDVEVVDSFWDTQTSGKNVDNGAGTGKTTVEMKNLATFANTNTAGLTNAWDFTNVWNINSTDNGGYPFLRWQGFSSNNTHRNHTTGSSQSRMSSQQIAQIFGLPQPTSNPSTSPSLQTSTGEALQTPPTQPPALCTITHVLKIKSPYTTEVKCLQNKLNITSDGKFGPRTKQAVMDFQKVNGLTVDGIVGKETKKALGV